MRKRLENGELVPKVESSSLTRRFAEREVRPILRDEPQASEVVADAFDVLGVEMSDESSSDIASPSRLRRTCSLSRLLDLSDAE